MIIYDNIEQGSDEWHELRAGTPTSSEFSRLVTSKGVPSKSMPDYAIQLAADLYAGSPQDRWEGNKWTERGHEMEDAARAYYENSFDDREVTRVGYITDDDGRMGTSPDSLVDEDGLLEIKCLKATRHIQALMYLQKNRRLPPDYVVQPIGQMLIAERDWCDVLFWHPELPAAIYRAEPDERIIINLRLQIEGCISERDRVIDVLQKY
jgi:hypothetical protein